MTNKPKVEYKIAEVMAGELIPGTQLNYLTFKGYIVFNTYELDDLHIFIATKTKISKKMVDDIIKYEYSVEIEDEEE